jgi:hypothetical protein
MLTLPYFMLDLLGITSCAVHEEGTFFSSLHGGATIMVWAGGGRWRGPRRAQQQQRKRANISAVERKGQGQEQQPQREGHGQLK